MELSAIKHFSRYFLISLGVLGLDIWTKQLAQIYLKGQGPWPPDWTLVRLEYAENFNMAFSLSFFKMSWVNFFALIATILILTNLWYYAHQRVLPSVSMALILGGALGNLGERLIRGYVVDFISFDWPDNLFFARWPTFNIADSAITIGLVLYVIFLLSERKHTSAATIPTER